MISNETLPVNQESQCIGDPCKFSISLVGLSPEEPNDKAIYAPQQLHLDYVLASKHLLRDPFLSDSTKIQYLAYAMGDIDWDDFSRQSVKELNEQGYVFYGVKS